MATLDFTGVKLRSNLLEWAEKTGAKFHRTGGEYRSCCPLHKGSDPSAFVVYQDNGIQKWRCYSDSCGGGDIFDFIQKAYNCDKKRAYEILGGEAQPDPQAVARAAAEAARRAEEQLHAEIERATRILNEIRATRTWLEYHANLEQCEEYRKLWRQRGIADDWQDYYQVGYCQSFSYRSNEQLYHSPTLTIPVMDENNEPLNIRHRLLNPINPKDKYRPEKPGLQAVPYLTRPTLAFNTDPIFVVEGEIKAMVTMQTLYHNGETMQVIGIPGKTAFHPLIDYLKGHDVYICLDPDAGKEAFDAAKAVGGKIIDLPVKIDDSILAGLLNERTLRLRMKSARKV